MENVTIKVYQLKAGSISKPLTLRPIGGEHPTIRTLGGNKPTKPRSVCNGYGNTNKGAAPGMRPIYFSPPKRKET